MPTKDQTAVYRCFAETGTLLYVGVAEDFGKRWREHAGLKPWWPEVARQTVDWYDSRDEALRVEKEAIQAERPAHNVVHAVDRERQPMPAPLPLTAEERARLEQYDDAPDEFMSEAELLDQLDLYTRASAWHKYRGVALIRYLLPTGTEVRRGLLTDVTDASPYKREYVSRIRDGIAANYAD
ncbi:GIY-YIG nuclease family protein [Streptomyces sp. NPDC102437]|uniref:GIY-YIG nuclease family protein n=1 Tax=Streptomyces sp. NPDC102437 TaxID=3366175 RepID=UPI003806FB35